MTSVSLKERFNAHKKANAYLKPTESGQVSSMRVHEQNCAHLKNRNYRVRVLERVRASDDLRSAEVRWIQKLGGHRALLNDG